MITQERLKEVLHYDKDSGVFTWINKPKKAHRIKIGDIAGCLKEDGYIRLAIDGSRYYAHRLAWLYEYGYIPYQIDHINQVRSDNRIVNLRESNDSLNMKNKTQYDNNTSGVTGVYWRKDRNRWIAKIRVDGEQIFLGMFTKYSDAVDARKNAEVLYNFYEGAE